MQHIIEIIFRQFKIWSIIEHFIHIRKLTLYIISRILKILPDVGFAPIFSNDHEEHIALIFT